VVTIKDVAREAAVSTATVSRVINGHGNCTDATRARILGVAARLRYVPDNAARSMITGRTHTIGVLLPDVYGEFFSEIIRGIDQAARLRHLHLLVTGVHDSAGDAAQAIRSMRGRVDGLLIMSPHADSDFLETNLDPEMPSVLINTRVSGGRHSALLIDNRRSAYAMVKHLLAVGHRRIAFVTGPEGNFDAAERLHGYREALRELAPRARELVLPGDFSEESGYRVGKSLAALDTLPDAVFAANDSMAIGCLFALKEAGLSVPEDVAVAGFDDIPMSRFMSPPLTTVHVPIAELGGRALDRLAAAIAKPGGKRVSETVAGELVVRASSGERSRHKPLQSRPSRKRRRNR
jgi:LacI family transcriptional regulator